jgi:hypothetical protein
MATTNKDGTLRKRGSGRTKGSVSFVETTLTELNNALKPLGDDAVVLVGRKWVEGLEGVGINLSARKLEVSKSTNDSNIQAITEKVEFSVIEF